MDAEIKTNSKTKQVLTVIQIVAWVIFIGLCIETGALLYSFFVSLFMNPEGTKNLYISLNLSELYQFKKHYYISLVSLIIFLSALKAFIFYLVIQIFLKINLVHPFSTEVNNLISRISYVAMSIGILTLIANGYADWLIKRGAALPDLEKYLGRGVEFLFFAGVIFFIAQIFKRGIEIQSENELTV